MSLEGTGLYLQLWVIFSFQGGETVPLPVWGLFLPNDCPGSGWSLLLGECPQLSQLSQTYFPWFHSSWIIRTTQGSQPLVLA